MPGTDQRLILGVDGGQTKTLTVLADDSGRILGSFRNGPSNNIHEPGGLKRQYTTLHEGMKGALAAAGIQPMPLQAAVLGLSGSGDQATIERAIPAEQLYRLNDADTALAGAIPLGPGMILIGGTGAIALGRGMDDGTARSGGWGAVAGDEGSGFDIGVKTIRAAFQMHDHRLADTGLPERVLQHFDCADMNEFHRQIMASSLSRDRLASAAVVAAEAADAGDQVALEILQRAGTELSPLVRGVLSQLDLQDTEVPLALVGSTVIRNEHVRTSLLNAVRLEFPKVYIRQPLLQPALGAVVIGLQSLGIVMDQTVLANLQAADAELGDGH